VRLGHEADGVVQRRVTRRKARRLEELGDAVVRAVLDRIDGQVGQPRWSISANNAGSIVSVKNAPSAPPSLSACVWISVIVYG
jgi:hypothetical protein